MSRERTVVIVGAGFSGTLLAVNLLRQGGVRVVLIERRREKIARGTAFGTRRPEHRLNVRVANMSAYPDEPDHFARWVGARQANDLNRFVGRGVYGRYIAEQLATMAETAGPERCRLLFGTAVAAGRGEDGRLVVRLADGGAVEGDVLVLAQGNRPPGTVPGFEGLGAPAYQADPWDDACLEGLGERDHVLLIGTGLTAVDIILSLDRAGFGGRITALSRRGLRPQSHLPVGPMVEKGERPAVDGSRLLAHVRRRARQVGWPAAVDELRPHTQDLWRRLDLAGQRRFLRHLRPYWDVHRHRIAPEAADRLAALEGERRLDFAAGKIVRVEPRGKGLLVQWRVRGGAAVRGLEVARAINCTGPGGGLLSGDNPLLASLAGQGRLRADPHDLGIDVDRLGRVRAADGAVQDDLYAVGPLTKGEAWEIIAVPDIRQQVWTLARRLTHSHWVGGEGL